GVPRHRQVAAVEGLPEVVAGKATAGEEREKGALVGSYDPDRDGIAGRRGADDVCRGGAVVAGGTSTGAGMRGPLGLGDDAARERDVARVAVLERGVRGAPRVRVAQVPGVAADDAGRVDAVAVPVAHDREIARVAVLEHDVRGAPRVRVAQVPGVAADNARRV